MTHSSTLERKTNKATIYVQYDCCICRTQRRFLLRNIVMDHTERFVLFCLSRYSCSRVQLFNFFQPILCNRPIFCNRNVLKWLSFHFCRNQQLTRHFFSINSKVAYVCLYVYIFFQGLEGIPWWSWFILAIVLLGKDRGGNVLQIRKDISQFRKDIPQFSKRYSAILQRYSAIFAKIFRNFAKIFRNFAKIFHNFRKDILQFSQRYSAIFAE